MIFHVFALVYTQRPNINIRIQSPLNHYFLNNLISTGYISRISKRNPPSIEYFIYMGR